MSEFRERPFRLILLFLGGICFANFLSITGLWYYQVQLQKEVRGRRSFNREVQAELLRHLRRVDPDGGVDPDLGALVN
jgi:hypothetical protein